MDSYKPLLTKKKLIRLCDDKRRSYHTPLEQARHAINHIGSLRAARYKKYNPGEWLDEPENKVYEKIAREYLRRKAEAIKARKEARNKQEN